MKKKPVEEKKSVRSNTLSVRLTDEERSDLQRLRKMLSPYSPLSEGKAISAAIKIALEKLG
jgi:hypothetical protein